MKNENEQMNVVIVGHVDHGKSTVIGRLLADTNALPEGKLDAVRENCKRNARPFEYAFLLDALKDEQSQGITIDTARCFFKSDNRDYIIIDAPGHIEFLKNMISGAARAEAAMLVIDAKEGIRENSRRHGYIMSFLGIKNITICVNKMDLVDYSEEVFLNIKKEYEAFLKEINLKPKEFIPISAREGDNIVEVSAKMPWYQGNSILQSLDGFKKLPPKENLPARFPLQDVYKFTAEGDDRRIFAGRIESGTFSVGDEIIFFPSKKTSTIKTIEDLNTDSRTDAFAGQCTGFTLDTQVYLKPGEIMCRNNEEAVHVNVKLKVNIFWMGKQPFVKGKNYKLKLGTQKVPVLLSEIISVLDASELSSIQKKNQVDRHDVAECVLETLKPIAFDEINKIEETGRFVIVDNYEIVAGGIVLAPVYEESSSLTEYIKDRERSWERSDITLVKRSRRYEHKSSLIVIAGREGTGKKEIAKSLEEELFKLGKFTYFLGISNSVLDENSNSNDQTMMKWQHIKHLGEIAHVCTDAGLLLIASITDIDEHEINML
ncbi:Sulfate adenylyltransferase subunit 1 / Adenylylsulfate kinase, partial [hydrothermal vent metagenome]